VKLFGQRQFSLLDGDVADYASTRFPEPRPKQREAHEKLREGRRAGHRVQMVMAPTGSGKTYIGLNAIQQALVKGRRAVFVCDRIPLINQTSAAADRYGLSAHGVIQADHWRTDPSYPFQIASVQSLSPNSLPPADLIVVDEAHTQHKTWVNWVAKTPASVILLSATPFSKGLGKIASNLVMAGTMDELTRDGVLVPMRVLRGTPIDMTGAATANGEWTDEAAAERGMQIVGDVVVEWMRHGENRKTICFGANIEHCEVLLEQFTKAGVQAALYTGHTKTEDRERLVAEFAKPDAECTLRVLISVEALAKGFDQPDVGCIIDCRPMRKSLSTVIQMWGRAARSFTCPITGFVKEDFILLDHSGNTLRFAESFEEIYYNGLEKLDDGEKLDSEVRKEPPPESKEKKGCPKCGFQPFAKHCMRCGFEIKPESQIEHAPGVMQEVQLGRQKKLVNAQDLFNQCMAYARKNSAPEKQNGRASHLYKDMVGEWPPFEWRNQVPADAVVSKEVQSKIISMNIRRAKSRVRPGAEA
jgi:superfamily II DNA or RNA helicase